MAGTGAVILAAGRGQRLGGVAKATLRRRDGETFLSAVVATARAAGCAPVVVVAAEPHLEVTRAAAAELGCAVAVNGAPERGMASSLAVGLCALAAEGAEGEDGEALTAALVWPVDHPDVDVATVRTVLGQAAADRAVIPTFEGRGGHPTAFGRAFWPRLLAAADSDEPGGARAVVRADPDHVVRIAVDCPGVVRDVDEAVDLTGVTG